MPITGSVTVWAEPIERRDLQLVLGDIQEAAEWFKDKTGQEPRMIILNPKNERLVGEANGSIKVNYSEACLTWEVWLAAEDNFVTSSQHTEVATESISGYPQTQPVEIHTEEQKPKMSTLNSSSLKVDNFRPRGRQTTYKKKELPELQIKQLHNEGIGAKAIATKLKKEWGIAVSYKTIQRVLSGERK